MFNLLLFLKFILYTNLINVQHNRLAVILVSILISSLVLIFINRIVLKYKYLHIFLFYSIVSIFMFVNAMYFAQFNSLTSVKLIRQITQLNAIGDSIRAIIDIKKLLLIIDLPIIILYCFRARNKNTIQANKPFIPKKFTTIITGGSLIILLLLFNHNGKIEAIATQELFTYHIIDIKENLFSKTESAPNLILTEEDIKELKSRAELKEGKLTGVGKGKNLIVLQVEALQNFVVNLKYNNQEITPNINRLINNKSTIYYSNYYQLLGRGNTSDAEFVSQNSLHPSMDEPTYIQYSDNTFYGLPWLLRDNGYTAWAFHGYKKEFWNRENAYINQGFQRFLSEENFVYENGIGLGLKDEDFFDQSIDYLKELDTTDENPFYAFMITLTSHTPFPMPEEYQFLNIKEEHKNTMLGNYLQAIHYADKEIGRFLERLEKENLYDNTIIALYGDHFGILSNNETDQKIMTDFLGYSYDFDTMMNIPLLIHIPHKEIQETNSTVGSQLDFYPTIANIMGYKNEKGLIMGRDLNNYKDKNYVYPQTYMLKGSLIDENSVFVISRDGIFENSRAYDIKTRKELDINQFKEKSKKAIEEIDKSNLILEYNLLNPN